MRICAALTMATMCACSLVAPSSDYFDDAGVETVAVVPNVRQAVATHALLYVASDRILLAGPADGLGDRTTVRTAAGDLRSLVSNDIDTVAWCEDGAGAWVRRNEESPARIPGSLACASIAVHGPTVAYFETSGSLTLRTFDVEQGRIVSERIVRTSDPSPALVAFSGDGTSYTVTSQGVARECLPDDRGCEDGLCRLASTTSASSNLAVIGSGAAARPMWVTDLQAVLFAPTRSCCAFADKSCDNDARRQRRGVTSSSNYAVRGSTLFALRESALRRVDSFVDPTQDVVVASATSGAQVLALGDRHAFFMDGDKLQRVRYRAP